MSEIENHLVTERKATVSAKLLEENKVLAEWKENCIENGIANLKMSLQQLQKSINFFLTDLISVEPVKGDGTIDGQCHELNESEYFEDDLGKVIQTIGN